MGNAPAERFARFESAWAVVAVVVVVVGLAGCSSGSKSSGASTSVAGAPTTASSTAAGSSSASDASPSASADDCGGAVARVISAVSSFPEVTTVQMIAACHEVDIHTNLPSGVLGSPSAAKGAEICDAAAKVAYQDDVSSITITDTSGHELATGLKSADCIPG